MFFFKTRMKHKDYFSGSLIGVKGKTKQKKVVRKGTLSVSVSTVHLRKGSFAYRIEERNERKLFFYRLLSRDRKRDVALSDVGVIQASELHSYGFISTEISGSHKAVRGSLLNWTVLQLYMHA